MSAREYGIALGYQPGQTISGAELSAFKRQYAEYRKQAVSGWEMSKDAEGTLIRVNPHTGLAMAITNEAGQPVKGASADPFGSYAAPSVAGAAPAGGEASMAFQGVKAQAAPEGNPVAAVNVNPAVRAQAQAAESGAKVAAPAYPRVRVTADEFEKAYGRKANSGTAFPYEDEQGNTVAIIEVQ